MKNLKRIIFGLLITIAIFVISNFTVQKFSLNIDFIPEIFGVHSIMLLLSILTIWLLRKKINFNISIPSFKNILKPISITILMILIAGLLRGIISKMTSQNIEDIPLLKLSVFQLFLFIFIYASIAEEILFRGFLLNYLNPLKLKTINLFKIKISYNVIISALAFGIVHFIVLANGASWNLSIFIVINATVIGLIAGYYQEKYDNTAFAIIVHMTANSLIVLAAFLLSINN